MSSLSFGLGAFLFIVGGVVFWAVSRGWHWVRVAGTAFRALRLVGLSEVPEGRRRAVSGAFVRCAHAYHRGSGLPVAFFSDGHYVEVRGFRDWAVYSLAGERILRCSGRFRRLNPQSAELLPVFGARAVARTALAVLEEQARIGERDA